MELRQEDQRFQLLHLLRHQMPLCSAKLSKTRAKTLRVMRLQFSLLDRQVWTFYDQIVAKNPGLNVVSKILSVSLSVSNGSFLPRIGSEEKIEALQVLAGIVLLSQTAKDSLAMADGVKILLERYFCPITSNSNNLENLNQYNNNNVISDDDERNAVSIAALDALLALLIDNPPAQMSFIHISGFSRIGSVVRSSSQNRSFRAKCAEFLALYLTNSGSQLTTESTKIHVAARAALGGPQMLRLLLETVAFDEKTNQLAPGTLFIDLIDAQAAEETAKQQQQQRQQ